VIVKCFKKCCICNAVDGRENGILWEVEKEAENVSSEMMKLGTVTTVRPNGETG
jgi:hypothetical protein